jgi:hypothetical protein
MPHSVYAGRASLQSLSEGNHTIIAHCIFKVDGYILTTDNKVIFNVDKTPPHVSVLTLQNKTYDTTEVPLNFIIDDALYCPSYSLDGNPWISIEGNTTLIGLTSGGHNLAVYAQDRAGNTGSSETIFFSVRTPEDFATMTVVVSTVIVIIASTLVIYLKYKTRASLR